MYPSTTDFPVTRDRPGYPPPHLFPGGVTYVGGVREGIKSEPESPLREVGTRARKRESEDPTVSSSTGRKEEKNGVRFQTRTLSSDGDRERDLYPF